MSITQFSNQMVALLPKVMRLMTRRQSNDLFKGRITLPQFMVLEFLYREKSDYGKIVEILAVSAPAATGIVDKLVRDGYLIRRYNLENRRIILIKLTTKGIKLIDEVIKQRKVLIKDMFGKLTEKERRDYLLILTKIYKTLLDNYRKK